MTRDDLQRELNLLGWELAIYPEPLFLQQRLLYYDVAYAVRFKPDGDLLYPRVRLGVIGLVLAAGLRVFRQRDVYKELSGGTT